jgi:hypothetical protein
MGNVLRACDRLWRSTMDETSLALIGNAAVQKFEAKPCTLGRGIFDKET